MKKFTNKQNIDLPLAVWLASDEYEGVNEHDTFSASTLLKSTKEIVLSERISAPLENAKVDLSTKIASRMGTAIHTAIEESWVSPTLDETLKALGYNEHHIQKLRVNPDIHEPSAFNVYLEQREFKDFEGFRINGQYDFIFDGEIHDIKTTGAFTWTNATKSEDYSLQGSIYRWLNQDKATASTVTIHFVFTDWNKLDSIKNPRSYPDSRIKSKQYDLLTIPETEQWLRNKLNEIVKYRNLLQSEMAPCTPEQLWQGKPVYKYYKDSNNTKRSNGNFDSPEGAYNKLHESGGVGVVLTVYGKPKKCKFCPALSICEQGQGYLANGDIKLEN